MKLGHRVVHYKKIVCILMAVLFTLSATPAFAAQKATDPAENMILPLYMDFDENYEMQLGETMRLRPNFYPEYTNCQEIEYFIEDNLIVSIFNGFMTAKHGGTTTVRALTPNGIEENFRVTVTDPQITHKHYYQSDSRWGFSKDVRKKACYLTAYTILIYNIGNHEATPASVYKVNRSTTINAPRVNEAFGVKSECALRMDSEYLDHYVPETGRTYIKNPLVNATAALDEMLDRNPEGVLMYFAKGEDAHAVVAVRTDEGKVMFIDPGRNKGLYLPYPDTWCSHHHKMTMYHLVCYVAIDRDNGVNE